ncbi:MAG: GC-type dockerin domain-anchored protein [Phycisphaerales bacterium]
MINRMLVIAGVGAVSVLAASGARADVLWDTIAIRNGTSQRNAGADTPVGHFTNNNAFPVHLTHISFSAYLFNGNPGTNFRFFRANAAGVVQGPTTVLFVGPTDPTTHGVDVNWTIAPGETCYIGAIHESGTVVYEWRLAPPYHTESGITGMANGGFAGYQNPVFEGNAAVEMSWRLEGQIVTTAPCLADVAGLGGAPGGDHQLTVDDVVYYLGRFFANDTSVADLVGLGGAGGPDGQVTADDIVAFLASFFAGCP